MQNFIGFEFKLSKASKRKSSKAFKFKLKLKLLSIWI